MWQQAPALTQCKSASEDAAVFDQTPANTIHNEENQVTSNFQLGDIVKFVRYGGVYYHYGIYIGDGKIIHRGVHRENIRRRFYQLLGRNALPGTIDKGIILEEYISDVGADDVVERHNLLDDWIRPLDPDVIVARARRRLKEEAYGLVTNNCEHFVTECRYGISRSEQVEDFQRKVRDIVKSCRISDAEKDYCAFVCITFPVSETPCNAALPDSSHSKPDPPRSSATKATTVEVGIGSQFQCSETTRTLCATKVNHTCGNDTMKVLDYDDFMDLDERRRFAELFCLVASRSVDQAAPRGHPTPPQHRPTTSQPSPDTAAQSSNHTAEQISNNTAAQPSPATAAQTPLDTAVLPSPNTALQPSPNTATQPSLDTAVQTSPDTAAQHSPDTAAQPTSKTASQTPPNTAAQLSLKTEVQPAPDTSQLSPNTAVQPFPDTAVQPSLDASVQPSPDTAVQPFLDAAVQPSPDTAAQPSPNLAVQPFPDTAVHPSPNLAAQPSPDTTPQPSPNTSVKPSSDTATQVRNSTAPQPFPLTVTQNSYSYACDGAASSESICGISGTTNMPAVCSNSSIPSSGRGGENAPTSTSLNASLTNAFAGGAFCGVSCAVFEYVKYGLKLILVVDLALVFTVVLSLWIENRQLLSPRSKLYLFYVCFFLFLYLLVYFAPIL